MTSIRWAEGLSVLSACIGLTCTHQEEDPNTLRGHAGSALPERFGASPIEIQYGAWPLVNKILPILCAWRQAFLQTTLSPPFKFQQHIVLWSTSSPVLVFRFFQQPSIISSGDKLERGLRLLCTVATGAPFQGCFDGLQLACYKL